mmetsp:Transcript_7755/g.31098  ORF Transcript_7755/g.31098 Transcript_7755/m.31098 type:complete len:234 (-) Transcript_7755:79-780(-)
MAHEARRDVANVAQAMVRVEARTFGVVQDQRRERARGDSRRDPDRIHRQCVRRVRGGGWQALRDPSRRRSTGENRDKVSRRRFRARAIAMARSFTESHARAHVDLDWASVNDGAIAARVCASRDTPIRFSTVSARANAAPSLCRPVKHSDRSPRIHITGAATAARCDAFYARNIVRHVATSALRASVLRRRFRGVRRPDVGARRAILPRRVLRATERLDDGANSRGKNILLQR